MDDPLEDPVDGMAAIAGGTYVMGSDRFYAEEAPRRSVHVEPFLIDLHPVTNAAFATFVDATGYVTIAEVAPKPDDYPSVAPERLVAGAAVFVPPSEPVDLRDPSQWWHYVEGADWRHPTGPASTIDGKDDHPVVQIAYADALAYATWAGKSLPTEAQWEYAARGGLDGADFVWGDERAPGGAVPANVWRGAFPCRSDGPWGTRPVASFPPNGYGLFDMTGQVWEWTRDYWSADHSSSVACCAPPTDPLAPAIPLRVVKGGSYLCADAYCLRYRPAARIAQAIDTSTCHLGFRCVAGFTVPVTVRFTVPPRPPARSPS